MFQRDPNRTIVSLGFKLLPRGTVLQGLEPFNKSQKTTCPEIKKFGQIT